MVLENLSEQFWRKIKYALLFILSVVLIYILHTKIIVKIPTVESTELLNAIDNYESILEKQTQYTTELKEIHEEIKGIDFKVFQQQKLNEIKDKTATIKAIYRQNNRNSKYFFGIQSATILELYFDAREKFSVLTQNREKITNKLNKCRANI